MASCLSLSVHTLTLAHITMMEGTTRMMLRNNRQQNPNPTKGHNEPAHTLTATRNRRSKGLPSLN